MPLPICALQSETGIRRTSSSESYNVLVEAYHPIVLGDIDRVEFSISSNGGASSTTTVTSRAMWYPDDSEFDDPLPGNWGGGPAPLWCYGVKIEMASYAVGYIDVIPTVYAGSGESRTLETIRIYNDKDGTDRRPSPKTVYWDWNGGNDANSGLTTGLPVKTFQRAVQVASTSNDCGGATIYVNAAGSHCVTGASYGFGTNYFTGGHHWLQVLPRPGLTREEVKLIPNNPDLDSTWMYFVGTAVAPATQDARIRVTDLTIVAPGVKFGAYTQVNTTIWVEHCLNVPPAPFDEPVLGTGLHIRSLETAAGCVDIPNETEGVDRIHVTSSTRRCMFGGGQWGDRTRGCWIDKFAGQVFQPQYDGSAISNIYVTDIYQEVGVSGRFEANGTFRIESRGGTTYRIQANAGYAGIDFVPSLAYLSGSSELGIRLENFTTSSNNNKYLAFLSGGYSGGLPWVDVTGSLVPESDSSAIVTNGRGGAYSAQNYNTFGPHSDIFQFRESPLTNVIISNFAVFPAWETQGIYGSSTAISGVAFVNYYDGGIGEGPRSYYFDTLKNILIRNSFISRFEVSDSNGVENSEIIDSCFGSLTASAGSITTYTGIVNVTHNHYTGTSLIGGSPTSGRFFADSNPAVNGDASVISTSQAYGTASTLWDRPSAWFSGNKGPWSNVALADWSYTEVTGGGGSPSVTGDAGITFSTAFCPTPLVKIASLVSEISLSGFVPAPSLYFNVSQSTLSNTGVIPAVSLGLTSLIGALETTGTAPNGTVGIQSSIPVITSTGEPVAPLTEGGQFIVFPDTIVSASSIPNITIAVTPPIGIFESTGQVFATDVSSVIASPYTTITFGSSEVEQVTTYAIIGVTSVPTITFESSEATAVVSIPTIIQVSDTTTITFSSSEVDRVVTTVVPIGPMVQPEPTIPLYTIEQDSSTITLEQTSSIVDNNILPILVELNAVQNNVTRLPEDSRAVWSQNIIENSNSTQVTRTIVNILTNNYHKFQQKQNSAASRSITNRQQF